METGIYKHNGTFGFYDHTSGFKPFPSREKARQFARELGIVTTTRGEYVPPVIPVKGTKRGYTHYGWNTTPIGTQIVACSKQDYNKVLTAAKLYQSKHPEFDFTVTLENNNFVFTRVEVGEGSILKQKEKYNFGHFAPYDTMVTCAYADRMRVYNSCVQYRMRHAEFRFRMDSHKEEGTADFIRMPLDN